MLTKAFARAERIEIAPLEPPPLKALPTPNNETPSPRRSTPEQQRRLSALIRSRMVTSEGLSPE